MFVSVLRPPASGNPLFIQPCYETRGSLFAEPVFVRPSEKENSVYIFTEAVTSV